MAKDKNVIQVYRDWIVMFEDLTDAELGELMRTMFLYVNDMNPEEPKSPTLKLAWKVIKNQLKRDLKKWEDKCDRNRKNALVRWDATAYERMRTDAMDADKIREDKIREDNNKAFDFRKAFIGLGVDKNILNDWLKVRKTKKATNTETAFNLIKKQIELSGKSANECIEIAAANSWAAYKAEWDGKKPQKRSSDPSKRMQGNEIFMKYD